MNWWNRYIERAFVKSFANREEGLRKFIAHNFEGRHIHNNPPKKSDHGYVPWENASSWQRAHHASGEELQFRNMGCC